MKKSIFGLFILAAMLFSTLVNAGTENSQSEVDVKASKLEWKGKKIGGEHYGNVALVNGQLKLNGGKLTGGSFVIDMNSITNIDITDEEYNQKLIGHLKSDDFFATDKFPTAKFVITKVEHQGGDNYNVSGNLTIKDITHPITFPATVTTKNGKTTATANLTFDRSKFNVKYASKSFFASIGDKVIYDDVEMKITLVTSSTVANK